MNLFTKDFELACLQPSPLRNALELRRLKVQKKFTNPFPTSPQFFAHPCRTPPPLARSISPSKGKEAAVLPGRLYSLLSRCLMNMSYSGGRGASIGWLVSYPALAAIAGGCCCVFHKHQLVRLLLVTRATFNP